MTDEEKLKVYKEGYRDGYNDAIKFYITNPHLNTHPDYYKCPVCNVTGVRGMVCSVPGCPTRATSIGAAGSSSMSDMPTGANGPVDPGKVW